MEVHKLMREDEGTVYYHGDTEIVSATYNGEPATIVLAKAMPEGSCTYVWENGVRGDPICGGFMARIAAPEVGAIVLTGADASTHEATI